MSVSVLCNAERSSVNHNSLNALLSVNREWSRQPERYEMSAQLNLPVNTSYTQLIALHLMLVEKTLRARNTNHLSLAQKQNRINLLDKLRGYWQAKTFPINDYVNYKTPVFIDRHGTHCAVGYLMQQSGADWLAQQINTAQQFAYVREIKNEGVAIWAEQNGFTIDELAWIQPNYWPPTSFTNIGSGINGPVKCFYPSRDTAYLLGSFDTVDALPCNNIARYYDGQLHCLDNGLTGQVNDLLVASTLNITAAGDFSINGVNYLLAQHSGSGWTYDSIPHRANAVGEAITYGYYTTYGAYSHPIVMSVNSPSFPDQREIWARRTNGTWDHLADVNGIIKKIAYTNIGLVYAGHFDSVIIHRYGHGDTIITVHNMVFQNNTIWTGTDGNLSDTVLMVKQIGSAIYIGGTCLGLNGYNRICLSRYLNNTLQPICLSNSHYSRSINDIALFDDANLIVTGNIDNSTISSSIYDCAGLALYNLANENFVGYGVFDAPINSVIQTPYSHQWLLGGGFSWAYGAPSIAHIAKINMSTAIDEEASSIPSVFPNPSNNIIHVQAANGGQILSTEITSITGQQIFTSTEHYNSKDISVSSWAPGVYILRTFNGSEWGTVKILKE